jgi:hypothetical protein
MVTKVNNDKLHHLHEEKSSSIQMVATLSQSDLVDGTESLVARELRRHHKGAVNAKYSYFHMVTGVDNNKLHHLPEERMPGLQMATNLFQSKSVDGMGALVPKELRRYHDGVIEMKCSCTNIEQAVSNNKISHLMKKKSEQWMTHSASSHIKRKVTEPFFQLSMHPKTCNKYPSSPQMAIDLHHRELVSSSYIQRIDGLSGGLCI